MVEINEAERKKEKRTLKNEDNIRDLWDNVKHTNIQIIGVPEEEDKKKGHEKILDEIIVENSLKGERNSRPSRRNPEGPKQDKCPPNQTKEEEIGNLPDKEFQTMTVKMIQNLEKKMELQTNSVETRI